MSPCHGESAGLTPAGVLRVPNESVRLHTSRDVSQRHDLFQARRQDVGKPVFRRQRIHGRDRQFKSGRPQF